MLVAVIAAAAVGAAIDWTWEIPAVFGPARGLRGPPARLGAAHQRLRRDGYWLGVGTVAAAWVAMVAGGLVVLTEIELERSRDAAAADQIADGIDRAEQAQHGHAVVGRALPPAGPPRRAEREPATRRSAS